MSTHDGREDMARRLEEAYEASGRHERRDTYVDSRGYGVWLIEYDRREATFGHEGAVRSVLNDIAQIEERPLPYPPDPAPPVYRGRIRRDGRRLVYPDGAPFIWRGVTGFLCVEQIVRGREGEARSYLEWARQTGFSVVRVLGMLPGGWTDGHAFSPGEGLAALPRLLALAQEVGIYLHITILNNTASLPEAEDLGQWVDQFGEAAGADVVALIEVANEPYHGVQRSDVHDPATLARWAEDAWILTSVLVALGASANDESTEMAHRVADVIVSHLDRSRDEWNMVRRVRELETVSADTGLPVINSEPHGFGESEQEPIPGGGTYRRLVNPSIAYAFGVLSRIFTVPSTFHFHDGLRSLIPRPNQQRCAEAFMAGTRIVPDEMVLSFRNAGWTQPDDVPVRAFDTSAAVRVYSGISGNTGIAVALGLTGDPRIEWGNGWRPSGEFGAMPGIAVWSIER